MSECCFLICLCKLHFLLNCFPQWVHRKARGAVEWAALMCVMRLLLCVKLQGQSKQGKFGGVTVCFISMWRAMPSLVVVVFWHRQHRKKGELSVCLKSKWRAMARLDLVVLWHRQHRKEGWWPECLATLQEVTVDCISKSKVGVDVEWAVLVCLFR